MAMTFLNGQSHKIYGGGLLILRSKRRNLQMSCWSRFFCFDDATRQPFIHWSVVIKVFSVQIFLRFEIQILKVDPMLFQRRSQSKWIIDWHGFFPFATAIYRYLDHLLRQTARTLLSNWVRTEENRGVDLKEIEVNVW